MENRGGLADHDEVAGSSSVAMWLDDVRLHIGEVFNDQLCRSIETLARNSAALDSMFATMDEGVSVFDRNLKLVIANRRFGQILDLPMKLCLPGTTYEEIVKCNVTRDHHGQVDPDEEVRELIERVQRSQPHQFERRRADGTTLEIRGRPLPQGGWVSIYSDITERSHTEVALRESKAVLEATFEHMDQGISITNANLVMVGYNRRFQELLDFPASLCKPGTPYSAFIRYNAERGDYGPGDIEELVRSRVAIAKTFTAHVFERERPDGTILEIRGTPMPSGGFVTIYSDVTKRARAERELRESESRFRSLTELSSDWYWEQDAECRFTRVVGRDAGDVSAFDADLGKSFRELGFEIEGGWEAHEAMIAAGMPYRDAIVQGTFRDGLLRFLRISGEPHADAHGGLLGYRGVGRDITPQKSAEARVQYLATHDPLTDLPNRVLMRDRLAQGIERSRRNALQAAVLFLDLDRFKYINDSLGHAAGDQLLIQVALRLKGCVRASDTVSRQGGDEFVVLLFDVAPAEGPTRVAEKILDALAAPFEVHGRSLTISASIGIAVFPNNGEEVDQLTKNADTAMYLAKQSGRNAFRFFTDEMGDFATRRFDLEQQIADGIRKNEFILHYQPLCRASDGVVVGAEALVRWSRNGGLMPPCDFIPIAEESGQIVELGDSVLNMACRQAYFWNLGRTAPLVVSVNVSAHQFRAPAFVQRVAEILADVGLQACQLELEITETVLIGTADRAENILRDLKLLGVRIALDDFGTGYSSLSYLGRFPVDRIKIDKSFIQGFEGNVTGQAIVKAMIDLGRALKLDVVAEGVETEVQENLLKDMGCQHFQGFLLGKPVIATTFALPEEEVSNHCTPQSA